jgi:riboflavin transporter FmnP
MLLLSGLFLVYLIHLIGTTRELLAGAGPGGKIKIGWKVSQIMGMLYLGAVGMGTFLMTLCLAGVELAIGTTAVFLISIVLNLFLVVPVYGRMLETLLVKEIRKEEGQV